MNWLHQPQMGMVFSNKLEYISNMFLHVQCTSSLQKRWPTSAGKNYAILYNLTSLSDRLSSSRFSLSCSSRGYFKHGKSTTGHFMLRKSSFCCHLAWLAACAPEKDLLEEVYNNCIQYPSQLYSELQWRKHCFTTAKIFLCYSRNFKFVTLQ